MGDYDSANQVMAERFGWLIVGLFAFMALSAFFAEHPDAPARAFSYWDAR